MSQDQEKKQSANPDSLRVGDDQPTENKRFSYNKGVEQALQFLDTLRSSSKMAQELINSSREMALRIQSLESELKNEKARSSFLEREIGQLRNGLARLAFEDESLANQFEWLIEDQNCMAHLFVTSEQLAMVTSPQEAIQATSEVLHNLLGAVKYGIWLHWNEAGSPQLVASDVAQDQLSEYTDLVAKCIKSGSVQQPDGTAQEAPPICVPLLLGKEPVGAILVAALVPQSPKLERLHHDLLALLSNRLAKTITSGKVEGSELDRWQASRRVFFD